MVAPSHLKASDVVRIGIERIGHVENHVDLKPE
jgi:hypothetical protein